MPRCLATNALRFCDFWSKTEGLATLAHEIRGRLALVDWRDRIGHSVLLDF